MSRISGVTYQYTWDVGSIASNAQATLDITIPGAKLGDYLFVSAEQDLQHLQLYAHVESNTGASDVHLHNATGGPLDPGTLTINVLHVSKSVMFGN